MMPRETAVAPLHWNFTITPNSSGNFVIIIDPFQPNGLLYQDATVTGLGAGVLTNLPFAQDATIVDQFRLVSASLQLKYFGNLSSLSGFMVGAITSNVASANVTDFLTFGNIENLSNKKVLSAMDGIRLIYSPSDSNALDFESNTAYSGNTHSCKWKYLFVIYGSGFPNTTCIRGDYHRNIEYEAKPAFKEYVPHTKDMPTDIDNSVLDNFGKIGAASNDV
jgi:hypothetical protein